MFFNKGYRLSVIYYYSYIMFKYIHIYIFIVVCCGSSIRIKYLLCKLLCNHIIIRMAMGDLPGAIAYGKKYEQAVAYSQIQPMHSESFTHYYLKVGEGGLD